ncbi:MarR family winged helix-turn-helix transcriptional regulator [Frondihabitans sp. VKM Ac-2883]|uniref:MarR family winged helix-turn-helix transcriptional regulator n=1 Tax=Frondihabitans sp. VKM Ac-2883 TaxID=2783823 RepID=UPI00188B821F|nr:MarR family winged helix-turn-helix transcriptional regulator [Frondihabitans sp. VKM Ac-2883]MBF4577913.1 winged helix-turn-helix transcriptional regulator [Frondihabitans sp. VKM Ac-2883]
MTTTVNTTPNPKTTLEPSPPEPDANPIATIRSALFAFDHAHRVFLDTAAHQLGVGTTDLDALLQLAEDEPVTPGQLRAHLQLTTGAITAVTDRLDAAGYLTRLQHPTDRRSLLLVLTPTGRNAVHDVLTRYDALITRLPDGAMTHKYLKSLADVVLQASSDDFS